MLEQPNLHYLEKFCTVQSNPNGCLIGLYYTQFLESLLLVILKHLTESCSEKKVYAIRFFGFYVLRSLEEFLEMIKSMELSEQSDE